MSVSNADWGPGQQYNNTQNGSHNWQFNTIISIPEPVPSLVLPRRDPHYVEREDLLQELQSKAIPGAWVALVGLGGVGKTQLAIRYAQSLKDVFVLWIFASNAARFEESIQDILGQLKIPSHEQHHLSLLQNWLAVRRRWLLILDNVDNAGFLLAPAQGSKRIIDYFPACDHGTILFTSRSRHEAMRFELDIIDVHPMDAVHAERLFKQRGLEDTARLAEYLDYIPLALTQAASYIKQKRRYTVERYLAELESQQSRTNILKQSVNIRDSPVMLTWQVSFNHISSIRKSAADLLSLMSFCDRQSIPETLIKDVPQALPWDSPRKEQSTFDDDIQLLEDFSFVIPSTSNTWYMHRLVQDATQSWQSNAQRRFIYQLYKIMPNGDYENRQLCQTLLPHVQAASLLKFNEDNEALCWAFIAHNAAWYYDKNGPISLLEHYAKISLSITSTILGENNLDTIKSKAILSQAHRVQGRMLEAEKLELEILSIRQDKLGPRHPLTVTTMHNLAIVYLQQRRYEEAENLQEQVIAIRKKELGEEDQLTLLGMTALASTYTCQGRLAEAHHLHRRVLGIRQRILGFEHPSTLVSMAELGLVLIRQEIWTEAEECLTEMLALRRTSASDDHPHILTAMGNLSFIYEKQGRNEEASQLAEAVLARRIDSWGPEHPHTFDSVWDLSVLYYNQSKLEQAAGLMRDCAEVRKRLLGAENPATRESIEWLAKVEKEISNGIDTAPD